MKMTSSNEEVIKRMTYEIYADEHNEPYLKWVERKPNTPRVRGHWVPIGKITDFTIERTIQINQEVGGLLVLIDEDHVYRALVLID
jgi:hypothetical protein